MPHVTNQLRRRYRVRCSASVSEVVARTVALVDSRLSAVNSRWHAITTFVVAAEVAQADAEHSTRSNKRQEVAWSSDRVNNKVHALSSDSAVKSWVTMRATAAIARAMATITVKGALETGWSADLKAVHIRTSSIGCRPSAPHPNKRSSKTKARERTPQATLPTASPLQTSKN